MIYSNRSNGNVPVHNQFRIANKNYLTWSKRDFTRILSLKDTGLPLRNGVDNFLPIVGPVFPSILGSRRVHSMRMRTGRPHHRDTYLNLKTSSHRLRGNILSCGLYNSDLSGRYTSSFEINRSRLFLKQFEDTWCDWFDTDFGIDLWTQDIPLSMFQYHTWLRYPSHCASTDDPLEILFGYLYYLENQVRNDSLGLLKFYLEPYRESNLPLFLLNEDLGRFKDWNLVFTNVDKLHYYTPDQYFSLDPLQGNRINSIVGQDRIVLTIKDNTLLSFLNHWNDIGTVFSNNLIKNFSDDYRYVSTVWNIFSRHSKFKALGLGISYILMAFHDFEIVPGLKIGKYRSHKSYLQTFNLNKPLGLALEFNSFKLDSLLRWLDHNFSLITPDTLGNDKQMVSSRIGEWKDKFYEFVSKLTDSWTINPFTLFMMNFLFVSMNLYLVNFMWWLGSTYYLILRIQNNNNHLLNWSVYMGYGFNRTIPTRSFSSTNKQDEFYINDVWSSMFMKGPKDTLIFTGSDMIQNVCDYYRDNLILQTSNFDLYMGIRFSIRGDIQFNNDFKSVDNKETKGILKNIIVFPSKFDNDTPILFNSSTKKDKFVKRLIWDPFNPLNFGDNDHDKFRDWYSDINLMYRFTQAKIPNVFLFKKDNGEISTLSKGEESSLSKDRLEDWLKLFIMPDNLRENIIQSYLDTDKDDKESNEKLVEEEVSDDEAGDKDSNTSESELTMGKSSSTDGKVPLKIPELGMFNLEKFADYNEPLAYGYKFFVYTVREISGFRRTHLLSYSQLHLYIANTLLFPFVEIPHRENENLVDLICKYDYKVIFSTRFGESFYHRTGDMTMNDGFIHLSFNSLRRRMQLVGTDPTHFIFLEGYRNHDSKLYNNAFPKFFLPIDLQFILEDKDAEALEISNNWTFKPLSRSFDLEFKHESISSNIYDDAIFLQGKQMSLRVGKEGTHHEVHSFNKSRFSVGIVFLLSKFKDLSFKLNVKLNLTLMDLALNRFGKNQNLTSFGFDLIPYPFHSFTLTGNYLRLLGDSLPARGLRLIGDFFLILRSLMYSRISGDSVNLFNLYNYRFIDNYSKFLWGRYNGIPVDLSVFLFNLPEVIKDLLRDGTLDTGIVLELGSIVGSLMEIKRAKSPLPQRVIGLKNITVKAIPILFKNFYPLAKLMLIHYPAYFIKKFLVPCFRPDLYLQYLNLMFELNFKVLLKIRYYNIVYLQLLSLMLNIPKDLIDDSGRIEILRLNVYQLFWHYWFSTADNLNLSFVERSCDIDYKEIGIDEVGYRPHIKFLILGRSHKKISVNETLNAIRSRFNWYYVKLSTFRDNVMSTLRYFQ